MLIQSFLETAGHGMPATPPGLDSQRFFFFFFLSFLELVLGEERGKLAVELSQQAEKQADK